MGSRPLLAVVTGGVDGVPNSSTPWQDQLLTRIPDGVESMERTFLLLFLVCFELKTRVKLHLMEKHTLPVLKTVRVVH